jgi:hypothetical protein
MTRFLKEYLLLHVFQSGCQMYLAINTCNCCKLYKSVACNKFVLAAMITICTCSVGGGGEWGYSYVVDGNWVLFYCTSHSPLLLIKWSLSQVQFFFFATSWFDWPITEKNWHYGPQNKRLIFGPFIKVKRRTTFCQCIWDKSEVLRKTCWGTFLAWANTPLQRTPYLFNCGNNVTKKNNVRWPLEIRLSRTPHWLYKSSYPSN